MKIVIEEKEGKVSLTLEGNSNSAVLAIVQIMSQEKTFRKVIEASAELYKLSAEEIKIHVDESMVFTRVQKTT
jgi:hypothetical protein